MKMNFKSRESRDWVWILECRLWWKREWLRMAVVVVGGKRESNDGLV